MRQKHLHSKKMPRQHLRALFSDSSSGILSKHDCFLARWLWHTQSKILPKHHLSATRSLWLAYFKESLETPPLCSKVTMAESVEDCLETLVLCCQVVGLRQGHATKPTCAFPKRMPGGKDIESGGEISNFICRCPFLVPNLLMRQNLPSK